MPKAGTDPAPVTLRSSLVSQRPLLVLSDCIPLLTQPGEDPTRQGGLLPGQGQVRSLRVWNLNTDGEPNSQQALGTNMPRLNSPEFSFYTLALRGGLGLLPPAASGHGPPLPLSLSPQTEQLALISFFPSPGTQQALHKYRLKEWNEQGSRDGKRDPRVFVYHERQKSICESEASARMSSPGRQPRREGAAGAGSCIPLQASPHRGGTASLRNPRPRRAGQGTQGRVSVFTS